MYYQQVYWKEDGIFKKHVCFSTLKSCKKLETFFEIDDSLSIEEVNHFLDFFSYVLDPTKYKIEIKKSNETWIPDQYKNTIDGAIKDLVVVELNSLTKCKNLVYLTIFRYVQEFPEFVKHLFNNKDLSREEAFENFLLKHRKEKRDFNKVKVDGLGHAISPHESSIPYCPVKEKIDIKETKKLIFDLGTERSVYRHF